MTIASINEHRSRAAALHKQAQEINDNPKGENGKLTPEQRDKIDNLMGEVDQALNDAQREERLAGIGQQIAPEERGNRLPEVVEDPETTPEERQAVEMTATDEYRDAFVQYTRRGEGGLAPEQRRLLYEARALTEGTDAEGGYLAPEQLIAGVQREAAEREQLAPRMNTINTGARMIKITREADAVQFGWIAEQGQKPEDQPAFDQVNIGVHVGAGVVWISDELMEDSTFGLVPYISVLAGEAKVELEETAFMTGSGAGQPFGLLARLNGETDTPNRRTTAGIGALAGDDFVNALYALDPRYRRNATWVLGTQAIIATRLLKENGDSGQYLWQPGLQAGEPSTILGRPVVEAISDGLNNGVVGGNDVGVVGDLRRYTVLRRLQLQVKRLEELRALTDEVGLRFRFRTGGDVQTLRAFKSMRIRAA